MYYADDYQISFWNASWQLLKNDTDERSPFTRKPVCDQVRLKPVSSASETNWNLEISDIETKDIILSRQRTTKALIRLLSVPLLFAYGKNRFSHDLAQRNQHISGQFILFVGYPDPWRSSAWLFRAVTFCAVITCLLGQWVSVAQFGKG